MVVGIIEQIVYLRQTDFIGPQLNTWDSERYLNAEMSFAGAPWTPRRRNAIWLSTSINCSAGNTIRRAIPFPGKHYRVDDKDLSFQVRQGGGSCRVQMIGTDAGQDLHVLSHLHAGDLEIRYVRIKPRSAELSGNVEDIHRSDLKEFSQLTSYREDVDPSRKPPKWGHFRSFDRPNGICEGDTSQKAIRSVLK